jgi:hypothetical protein
LTKLFGLQSEANVLEKAFVAAADIEKELEMFAKKRRRKHSKMSGVYLSEHQQ